MLRFTALATLLLATTSTHAQDNGGCATVTTVENFDIDVYAAAPWYVHQQAENSYSPIEQNFCVKAEYTVRDKNTFWGYSVDVFNQAQTANGSPQEGNLCAYQTDEALSKLAVAPCWLPKFAAGPYWVVAYNETEGYALISGGQPTVPVDGGPLCRTGTGINNSGLWIFSRSQTRDEALVSKVRGIAEAAGFDLTVLNDVDQTSCDGCADVGGTFPTIRGEKDCDWVGGKFSWIKCLYFSDECPVTCGAC